MNTKKFLIIGSLGILIFISLYSCTKLDMKKAVADEGLQKISSVLSVPDTPNAYSYIILSGNQNVDRNDSSYHIDINASFTDSLTGQAVNTLGISINNRNLVSNSNHAYHFAYNDTSTTIQEGLSLYGTNVKIKITGTSSADTVTQMIYMPKKVYKTVNDFPTGSIGTSGNLVVSWTPDPLNSWGNVVIKIWYNSSMSRFLRDSSLSAQDIELTYTVPDNGSYTISSSDLQAFQPKSLVSIALGRGTKMQAVLPISKMRVFYFAVSSESTPPINIVCSANWQNTTAALRCQTKSNGANTGYQEQQQKDISTCSITYNQTRWITASYNLSACPIGGPIP